jgi:hypothetical protein
MSKLDGLFDPEGGRYLREALRFLSKPCEGDSRTPAQRRADALVEMARFVLHHREAPPGTKRARPKVVVNVNLDDLIKRAADSSRHSDRTDAPTPSPGPAPTTAPANEASDPAACPTFPASGGARDSVGGASRLWPQPDEPRSFGGHLGSTVLTSDAVRRLACDAGVHRLVTAGASCVMDYGRQTRSVSDALFAVLAMRDGSCRFFGCEVPAYYCDAHHAEHWADHGDTEPDNLPLLCWYHHHTVHEQHWSIQPLGAGHFQLVSATGVVMPMSPPLLALTNAG